MEKVIYSQLNKTPNLKPGKHTASIQDVKYDKKGNLVVEFKVEDTTLYAQLLTAKKDEETAIAHRVELEEEIYALHRSELQKSEGQETLENFGYKITINQPMVYKLDDAKYRKLAESLPEDLQFHRTKLELDKTKYSSLLVMSASPEVKKYIKKIQDCVSVKPGKVSVKVEKIEEE